MGAPVWSRLKYLSDCWMAWHELWYIHSWSTDDESLSHLWSPGFTLGARCRSKFSRFKWNIMTSTGVDWHSIWFRHSLLLEDVSYRLWSSDFSAITTFLGIPLSKDMTKHFHSRSRIELFGGIVVIFTGEVQLTFFCTVQNENDYINIQDNLQSDAQVLNLLLHQ